MIDNKRLELVAPCGIDCGICELYLCRDNQGLFDVLVSKGIPKEKIPCDGCRPNNGACPIMPETCKTYSCVSEKDLAFCTECNSFPCTKLHPAADRANVLPHNMKVYNLNQISRIGTQEFVKHSLENKKRYFSGKMEIGNGPQI
ncbi:MAG TPA: hypothetical protein DCG75_15195 [Bacteroidales bacterium]|jgi:hypothetical protein|nr:hypothetical protein [Bacteroidales bacterium]